jgi:hypothetical protein
MHANPDYALLPSLQIGSRSTPEKLAPKAGEGARQANDIQERGHQPGSRLAHASRHNEGRPMECSLDGKKYMEADNITFPDAGMIGLWSKADAQSYFDDLTLAGGKVD